MTCSRDAPRLLATREYGTTRLPKANDCLPTSAYVLDARRMISRISSTKVAYSIKQLLEIPKGIYRKLSRVKSYTHTHRMSDLTTAFWGMTINNYTESDLALVRSGYPDHMREIVYTLEEGEEGTPHIQAWIKLKRQQRLSFVKKLFPGAHFKALCSAEYQQNMKNYAQKLDPTARSPAVHRFGNDLHTIEGIVKKVINRLIELDLDLVKRAWVEREMVQEDYTMAKIFVSATYRQMFKQFGPDMYECLAVQHLNREDEKISDDSSSCLSGPEADTQTHTHTKEGEPAVHPFFSQRVDIPTTDGCPLVLRRQETAIEGEEGSEDGSEESEGDEDDCGPESSSGSEGDDSGCSESDAESED